MAPLDEPAAVGLVVDAVTVIVIPEQGLGGLETVKLAVPVQPLEFFAVTI